MLKPGHLRHLLFAAVLLWGGTLFAQHAQGRDHTVFHRPAPPPPPARQHAATPTAATTASAHSA